MEQPILDQLLELQKPLVDYFAIEKNNSPKYPANLLSKSGQIMVKNCIDWSLEELAEAYHEFNSLTHHLIKNELPQAHGRGVLYMVEMADTLHFILEGFLYLGIDSKVLTLQLTKHIPNKTGDEIPGDVMDWLWDKVTKNLTEYDTSAIPYLMELVNFKNPIIKTNVQRLELFERLMGLYLYHSKMVGNKLKLRPWREVEGVEEEAVIEAMISSFMVFIAMCQITGITLPHMVEAYKYKNVINLQRIEDDKNAKAKLR